VGTNDPDNQRVVTRVLTKQRRIPGDTGTPTEKRVKHQRFLCEIQN